jgi:hypothetical protein
MRRRYQSGPGRAPAAPRDRSPRTKRIPTGESSFPWIPGEVAYGPAPKLSSVMARITALYGPSPTEAAE